MMGAAGARQLLRCLARRFRANAPADHRAARAGAPRQAAKIPAARLAGGDPGAGGA